MPNKSKKTRISTALPSPAAPRSRVSKFVWAARFCFAGAVAVAGWLLIYTLTEKPMAGCAPGSACDRVMGSAWAYWLNLPVSAPAIVVYFTLLVCSITVTSRKAKEMERAWTVGFVASILVLAVASWFIYLQLNVIHSLCKYCTSAHVLSLAGAILFLAKAPRPAAVSPSRKVALAFVGLLPFTALVLGQTMAPHKINVVKLYRGTLKYDVRDVPLIGNVDAKAFILDLFDYTCPDCFEMHSHLTEARAKLTNSFSIIALPCPLDATCNPRVRKTPPKHKNACDYAKLGLALRRCGSDLFQKYDEWFFAAESIPTLDAARDEARMLAGKEALDKALADPWVNATLNKGFALYEQNGRETKTYRIPQLVIGNTLNIGPVRNTDELLKLLQDHLPEAGRLP